ncbi:MAG: hypothetical protein M1815_002341 [Lichina confinis]|nr:MAG: hypothetical protein M1815_002341 [Lichina confinis]
MQARLQPIPPATGRRPPTAKVEGVRARKVVRSDDRRTFAVDTDPTDDSTAPARSGRRPGSNAQASLSSHILTRWFAQEQHGPELGVDPSVGEFGATTSNAARRSVEQAFA